MYIDEKSKGEMAMRPEKYETKHEVEC